MMQQNANPAMSSSHRQFLFHENKNKRKEDGLQMFPTNLAFGPLFDLLEEGKKKKMVDKSVEQQTLCFIRGSRRSEQTSTTKIKHLAVLPCTHAHKEHEK